MKWTSFPGIRQLQRGDDGGELRAIDSGMGRGTMVNV